MTCSYTIYGSEIFIRVHQLVFIGHEFIISNLVPRVFSAFNSIEDPRDEKLAENRGKLENWR